MNDIQNQGENRNQGGFPNSGNQENSEFGQESANYDNEEAGNGMGGTYSGSQGMEAGDLRDTPSEFDEEGFDSGLEADDLSQKEFDSQGQSGTEELGTDENWDGETEDDAPSRSLDTEDRMDGDRPFHNEDERHPYV